MEAKLVWTSEPPTRPCFFWAKHRDGSATVLEARWGQDDEDSDIEFYRGTSWTHASYYQAFSGPIPAPAEPDGGAE